MSSVSCNKVKLCNWLCWHKDRDVTWRDSYSFSIWLIGEIHFPEWMGSSMGWPGWRNLPCVWEQLQVPFFGSNTDSYFFPRLSSAPPCSQRCTLRWSRVAITLQQPHCQPKIIGDVPLLSITAPKHFRDPGYQRWLCWRWDSGGGKGSKIQASLAATPLCREAQPG